MTVFCINNHSKKNKERNKERRSLCLKSLFKIIEEQGIQPKLWNFQRWYVAEILDNSGDGLGTRCTLDYIDWVAAKLLIDILHATYD